MNSDFDPVLALIIGYLMGGGSIIFTIWYMAWMAGKGTSDEQPTKERF